MSVPTDTELFQDPNDALVYQFDWSAFLGAATISTSSFAITGGDGLLTKDNESVVTGNQQTEVRLSTGTLKKRYRITNQIVTNETPAQTKEASFFLTIRND